MNCKKCHKEIPDGSLYCNYCGKKQETTKRKSRRRPRGSGSIRYDKRCKNNPYIAYAPRSTSGSGGRYIGAYKNAQEAQAALDKYFNDTHINYDNITVSQAYEKWSEKHFEQLSTSGKQGYKTSWAYLDPITYRKIKELKTADYQLCIDLCAQKFSRAQCEKVKQLCSQLCKFAMENDIIDKNYAQFIKLPKAEIKKEKSIFTNEEIKILWEHSDDKRVQIILFMIYTGFRVGEIFNIEKQNVHLDKGYLIGGSKSEAGINRPVPIIPSLVSFISHWLITSPGSYLLSGNKDNFRKREFYPVLSELGIIPPPIVKEKTDKNGKIQKIYKYDTRLTPHSTRHTFATLSVNAGIAPENLQKIIGHAKFETTADIYVHEDIERLKTDMFKLETLK